MASWIPYQGSEFLLALYLAAQHEAFRQSIIHTLPIKDFEKGFDLILTKKAVKVALTPDW